jgi:Putative Actinobacterial Holin-X, holin superfamily III
MERGRASVGNGAHEPGGAQALGDVARDVMDHASAILRDRLQIGKIEARRYAEHVRRDVAPRAAFRAGAAALAALAVLFALVALFLGIADALGSVAWAFAIYAAAFAVGAIAVASAAGRAVHRDEREEMARRFPTARMEATMPEHLLVEPRSRADALPQKVAEGRREAGGPVP